MDVRNGRTGRARACAVASALLLSGLTGCGIIPKDGPTGFEVRTQADVTVSDPGRIAYALVDISPLTVQILQTERQPPVLFSSLARNTTRADGRLAPADVVSVTIFESGAGGLFVPAEGGSRAGNFVQIPAQEIDRSGRISIPYAGQIPAVGLTTGQVAAEITERLKSRAIEPQVTVTVGDRTTSGVTFMGDVRNSTLLPIKPGGLRLLQGLALAGGSSGPPFSTVISIRRGGRTENALLTSIIQDPRQDIELAPQDLVTVNVVPRIFLAFGAVGSGGSSINIGLGAAGSSQPGRRFPIDRANMPLGEALAAAGGVSSGSADSRSVFLFRMVPRRDLVALGVDVTNFPGKEVPTVLRLNLNQAESFFLANQLYMKHNDIIFVSEAPVVDLQKLLGITNLLTTTALQYRP